MYKCNKCGNSEKFIGYVQEQGNAFIYQNDCGSDNGHVSGAEDLTKNNSVYTEHISENLSWAYFISDSDWKSSFELKKCCYCNSSDIIWH